MGGGRDPALAPGAGLLRRRRVRHGHDVPDRVGTAPHRKAFYASWQIAAQGASLLLSSAFGYALYTWMSEEDPYAWGWRIPFFFGLLVGPVGLYIRARMSETEEFVNTVREKTPLRTVLTQHLGRTLAGIVMLVGSPFVGALADRVGARRVMTFYFAPLPALLSALFPAAIRGSGLSVSYNVGVTLFGGIAPLVLTWLLDATGVLETPGYYYLVIAMVSLVGLHFVRTRYQGR